jgi:hypothetical protein
METLNFNDKVNSILSANGLDFTIEKQPLIGLDNRPTPYFGLFNSKTNECLSTCKSGYTVSQNRDIVELMLRGMEPFGSELSVQKAGSLHGGRKVFIQLAINGYAKMGNDVIKRYVTAIDSNDGSTSLSIGIGDLTMSCQNQFFKFYAKGDAKFRHTETITQKMKEIPYLIETALNESLRQIETYEKFASTPITRDLADKMVKYVLEYDRVYTSMEVLSKKSTRAINIMDNLYSHIEKEINDKGLNLWGLHSGITSFTTHESSVPKRDNARIESLLNGGAYKLNQKSLAFATKQLELA